MRKQSKFSITSLLLAILGARLLTGAQTSDAPEIERLLQEIPADRIQEILTPEMLERKAALPADLPRALTDNLIYRTRSILSFKKYYAERGELTTGGCMHSSHWEYELEYAPRDLSKISLQELVQRAELALVATVLTNQSHFSFGGFSSRITVRIEEVLEPAPEGLEIGDKVTFSSPFYDLTINGERLCSVRTGIETPGAGESLLLVGRNLEQSKDDIFVINYFRIQTDEVQPAPYSFLQQTEPSTVGKLKESRLAASSRLQ